MTDFASDTAAKQARILKWDIRYINLAKYVSTWSKDPRAKVGAVISNAAQQRIISMGFNGLPRKVMDTAERLENKEQKLAMVVHAEQNALIRAGRDAEGGNVYVFGKPVCNVCAALLIQARVDRVIAAEPKSGGDSDWDRLGLIALEMFQEAGVRFTSIQDSWIHIQI